MNCRVRFAPSPTGDLHIGSLRTALFNWAFARHNCGKFLLRIEDTDRARSTEKNIASILNIMELFDLNYDEEYVLQSERITRHIEVVDKMLEDGVAYKCYCRQEDLQRKKDDCIARGLSYKYDGTCRELEKDDMTKPFVVRIKSDKVGKSCLQDIVQGDIETDNSQLDDFILLRSDMTPTYMLSVVVDDHDMGITHVIRGSDHLTNTFRQMQIYKACGWDVPYFAHIPLIYGQDGQKLSKRHGAVNAKDYLKDGYLPEAMLNYLVRLGWSHGDDEIISKRQIVEWFSLDSVGKSPSRFDIQKLNHINSHYLREKDDEDLVHLIESIVDIPNEAARNNVLRGMCGLKKRASTLKELAEASVVYIDMPRNFEESCREYMQDINLTIIKKVADIIMNIGVSEELLLPECRKLAESIGVKFVVVAQTLRSALCGKLVSPSVFEIMQIIGQCDTIARLENFIRYCES